MNIAFFTESGWTGKIPENHPNMRTDVAWMKALDATHYNIHNPGLIDEFDLGICIIPKNNPEFDIRKIKSHCKQIAAMQEGPQWYFQDYSLDKQIWFYNILMEMDFLFVHNQIDKKYFKGLTGKECRILPSLMIDDVIDNHTLTNESDRMGVIIGGNFCSWYGGFDSYMVAQEFDEKIYIPSMGRKIDGEEQMEDLNHLPYMNWTEWIISLSQFKFGIHLMRTQAAGTFALNCAYLGIPCIGYSGLDTQMICHPYTTIDLGDLTSAKKLVTKLKDNKFYTKCSKMAKKMYTSYYDKNVFLEKFNGN